MKNRAIGGLVWICVRPGRWKRKDGKGFLERNNGKFWSYYHADAVSKYLFKKFYFSNLWKVMKRIATDWRQS